MKKIMIAMGAIMSLALGAFAVDVTSGTITNAVMFNGIAPGTSIVSRQWDRLYPTADGYTSYIGDGGAHWECTGSTEDSVITNLTGSLNDNFLQIDQTDTLYRWMNQIEADSTNAVSAGQGIYFASKVQFTASDETNGVNLVSDDSDKLLIWLRAADTNEDDVVDVTNLVITASVGFPGNNEKADFVISNFDVVPGTWYELLVKSDFYDNGSQQGIQFTVKMAADGTTSEADFYTLQTSDNVSTFYSMDGTGDDKATVTKVGFKGTGAVDNLEFGTYNVAVENYFSRNGTPYHSFDDAMDEAQPGDVVQLLKNYNSGTPIALEEGQEIVLDLAGHVISMDDNGYGVILNGGVLTITNSTVEVGCVDGGDAYAVVNSGTLTIVGGKYYGMGGLEGKDNNPVQNEGEMAVITVYYINNGTATESVLKQEASGDDAGYWVIKEVAFVHAVTFSTNGTYVVEYKTTVEDGKSLAAAQIPAFTGGVWDVDPTNAVITCDTNFNYTISGSNWPAAWSDDSAYAAAYTGKLTTWMTNNNISSMDTLTVADETAFLLNIAPDEAVDKTIDATAITIDGTTVKITVDQKLASANGVVYLMYGSTPALGSVKTITFVDGEGDTPSSMTTLEGETATAQFYKVGVGFAAPVTAEP